MRLKADDFLEPILPYLRDTLATPTGVAAIRALARQMPPALSGGFECRLGERAPDVDFCLCYVPAESRTGTLGPAGYWNHASIDPAAFAEPAWEGIQALFGAMNDPVSPLSKGLRNVWLEFDGPKMRSGVPVPGVFFSMNPDCQGQDYLLKCLQLLAGDSWPEYLTPNLARCCAALPSPARIFQAGILLSRKVSGVRLCISGLTPDGILAFLQAIGWMASGNELAEVLAMLSAFAKEIVLDLDLNQTVGLKLGLECYLDDQRRARVVPEWPIFLNHLVAIGLCLPEKREALLAWPGFSTRQVFGTVIFPRGLNHIKIVYQPHQPLQAKAYLFFWNVWVRARPALK